MISGFQASNIGQYGIEDFSWSSGGRIGSIARSTGAIAGPVSIKPGTGTSSPFFDSPILDAVGQIVSTWVGNRVATTRAIVPAVLPTPVRTEESVPVAASPIPTTVVPFIAPQVIDPEFAPTTTVYEQAPAGIYETNRAETDWEEYYRQYVELNPPEAEKPEDEKMFDWVLNPIQSAAELGRTVGWWGTPSTIPKPGGGFSDTAVGNGPIPAKVTVDTRTGRVTVCKRRRRRKLLTESDFNVLLRVATLPNKENVRIVLGKAIGRS